MAACPVRRRSGRRPEDEGWPLWLLVVVGLLVSAVAGTLLAGVLARLASGRGSWWRFWTQDLESSQWYDVLRSDVAAVGLLGLGAAALLAYRRQRTGEAVQRISAQQHRLELRRHDLVENTDLRARYAGASEQLGHAKPAVRLAGVYAVAQLADDWGRTEPAHRQVCIDVLCAYLRMPYDPRTAEPGERQVRLTIISVIRHHLQDPEDPLSWCRASLDFTGAIFDGGSFHGAQFAAGETSFGGAQFTDGTVNFQSARFTDGTVNFGGAWFTGGETSFDGAQFAGGTVTFQHSRSWDTPPLGIDWDNPPPGVVPPHPRDLLVRPPSRPVAGGDGEGDQVRGRDRPADGSSTESHPLAPN